MALSGKHSFDFFMPFVMSNISVYIHLDKSLITIMHHILNYTRLLPCCVWMIIDLVYIRHFFIVYNILSEGTFNINNTCLHARISFKGFCVNLYVSSTESYLLMDYNWMKLIFPRCGQCSECKMLPTAELAYSF